MRTRGAIFDVDGVLVDSYEAHFLSWQGVAQDLGKAFSREDFARTFGRTSADIIRECLGAPDEDIRAIDDRKEEAYRRIVGESFPAMDGARELIDALREAGFAIGAGSSGPPENVALALERLGCADAFGAIVTGRDVTRGKPDPQVFALARDRLGLESRDCVVFEDAPAGIEAARRASMRCVGLASTGRSVAELERAGADVVCTSLREITPLRLEALLTAPLQASQDASRIQRAQSD